MISTMVTTRLAKRKMPKIMGILNITPDSFFDGGKYFHLDSAINHAEEMINQGAEIIDVGGESMRPGATPISSDEELNRIIPVIEKIKNLPATISIDTTKTAVMQAAIAAGASMVNDVTALTAPGAKTLIAKTGVKVCLVHHKSADTMQSIVSDLKKIITDCLNAKIKTEQIIIDPGFGFGKKGQQNVSLLNQLEQLQPLKFPILVGLSNKSLSSEQSIAAARIAVNKGASIIRVHDVSGHVKILTLL